MKTALPDYEIANNEASALFDTLGLTVNVSVPRGEAKQETSADAWPCIAYAFEFSKGSNTVRQDYRLGVGHVKWPTTFETIPQGGDVAVFNTLRQNPRAELKDKFAHATAAALLAKVQKVSPKPHQVLACLCSEAHEAHGMSFAVWCDTFGADSDSIKAKANYENCAQLYFPLTELIGAGNVAKLAELNNQF